MIDVTDVKTSLAPYEAPSTLVSLIELQNAGSDYYSTGFEITGRDGKGMLSTYSADDEFQRQFRGFANADGTGSEYMFWLKDNEMNLLNCPIVAFGSEGGVHVVASKFSELLQLLSMDIVPMIMWDNIIFYKDEDEGNCLRHSAYLNWLKGQNIKPVSDASEIMDRAQSTYKAELNALIERIAQEEELVDTLPVTPSKLERLEETVLQKIIRVLRGK